MSPVRNPAPPRAEVVEIRPLPDCGQVRAVAVLHDGTGGASLSVHHRVDNLAEANDYHPLHGQLRRSVVYLTTDERIELARELVRGLLYVRLEVRRD